MSAKCFQWSFDAALWHLIITKQLCTLVYDLLFKWIIKSPDNDQQTGLTTGHPQGLNYFNNDIISFSNNSLSKDLKQLRTAQDST